jgi:hypothetical protein
LPRYEIPLEKVAPAESLGSVPQKNPLKMEVNFYVFDPGKVEIRRFFNSK